MGVGVKCEGTSHATTVDIEGKTPRKQKRFLAARTREKKVNLSPVFVVVFWIYRRRRGGVEGASVRGGAESRWHPFAQKCWRRKAEWESSIRRRTGAKWFGLVNMCRVRRVCSFFSCVFVFVCFWFCFWPSFRQIKKETFSRHEDCANCLVACEFCQVLNIVDSAKTFVVVRLLFSYFVACM